MWARPDHSIGLSPRAGTYLKSFKAQAVSSAYRVLPQVFHILECFYGSMDLALEHSQLARYFAYSPFRLRVREEAEYLEPPAKPGRPRGILPFRPIANRASGRCDSARHVFLQAWPRRRNLAFSRAKGQS